MITLKEIKVRLRDQLWPFPGEAKSLRAAHDAMFVNALIDLQKWVPCLQSNNLSLYPWCSTYFNCGLTVFDAPIGWIKKVYTIVGEDWCNQVGYESAPYDDLVCWSNHMADFTTPLNVGLEKLPQGMKFVEKGLDSIVGRAHCGKYALERRRLYVAPWIQSNETAVVEWDGVKKAWEDTDVLDEDVWTTDVLDAVRLYVAWRHECQFGCDVNAREAAKRDWADKLAELIWECKEQQTLQVDKPCNNSHVLTAAQLAEEVVSSEPETIVFAQIGDYGDLSSPAIADVAALVKTFNPEFVLTSGDNYYGAASTFEEYDETTGQHYQQFIFPYQGIYGAGATRNKFWPTLGNHDRDPVGNLPIHHLFYPKLPNNGEYYDVVIGPIHLFIVDSGYDNSQVNRQADGITSTSKQGEWLRVKMSISTAKWKVVVFHHPPYTSTPTILTDPELVAGDGSLSYIKLRWPFKDWGADLVINGHSHNYERLIVDGLPYVVNGLGGRTTADILGTPNANSVKTFKDDWGAMKCTVTCDTFKGEFFTRAGLLIDSFEL